MLVVVGGHSRNIGKTSVVAGIIRALPEAGWTAMKITQFGHGICGADGHECSCGTGMEHPYSVSQELNPKESTDSARFLDAGALYAYWVRTAEGGLGHAVPAIQRLVEDSRNTIAESNSLLQFLRPDLYLAVLDFSVGDFKKSALRHLDRADAVVVVDSGEQAPAWQGVSPRLWERKPRFMVKAPQYVTAEIVSFVRSRLGVG